MYITFIGFGVNPKYLPISNIRPDVFHLCMGITKRLLKQLRYMLECQSYDVQEAFNLHLMEFLTDEQLLIWKLDKPIDSFVGGELKNFSKNAASMAQWAENHRLVSSTNTDWRDMAEALKLWVKIHEFIIKAKIKDGDDYEEEIKQFEVLVKQFYEYGKKTFLASRAGLIGSMETTYMHILQYNLASLARSTFRRHKV